MVCCKKLKEIYENEYTFLFNNKFFLLGLTFSIRWTESDLFNLFEWGNILSCTKATSWYEEGTF